MSKRSRKARANPLPPVQQSPRASRFSRRSIFIAAAMALLLAFAVGTLYYNSEKAQSSRQAAAKNRPALARDHAPALGNADAGVHIVEFLDPACGTCAAFYPHVKKLMEANPGRIRLSVRHVPFHDGSDHVVRILEAARSQGKYWQTLEAVFASQDRWVVNHVVQAERIWPALDGFGLDLERIRSEMNSPAIAQRMEQDLADARVLSVTKTPEYFVNGRPLPRFGLEELQGLVKQELRGAYP